jgi:predicted SAM-dependent methyltransferase
MSTLVSFLRRLHLEDTARFVAYHSMTTRRRLMGRDSRLIATYYAQHAVRKLHLGCGTFVLDGWLNTDLFPKSPSVVQLDATQTFPLPSATVDATYSQHIIEHVPYADGLRLLSEAYRVLKPGGTLRIATPDLRFLLAVYTRPADPLHQRYISWSIKRHVSDAPYVDRVFVVNNYFRAWGHAFIYDEATLRTAFERAGFSKVRRMALNESADPLLRGLSCADVLDEFLVLETMTLEAQK